MMTLNEIIGFISSELANEILDDTFQVDRPLYKTVSSEAAATLKLRPVFFEKKPRRERNKIILDLLTRPRMQGTAATLLRGWLVKTEAPMLADFLDILGVPHKNGVVDDFPETIDESKLNTAVDQLLEKYPHEKVLVYLNSFSAMNDAPWEGLTKRLRDDKRLQLA
jgi:hypothetical protein